MLTKFLAEQRLKIAMLERDVFKSPPKDFVEFKYRLGQWVALSEAVNEIEELIEDADK